MTIPPLLVLAALAFLTSRRRPDLRPLAWTLAGLAAIDLARLGTAPLAHSYRLAPSPALLPWRLLDVALATVWPGVVAVGSVVVAAEPAARVRVEVSRESATVGAGSDPFRVAASADGGVLGAADLLHAAHPTTLTAIARAR